MTKYKVVQTDEVAPVDCPCGQSRRAFVGPDNTTATLHLLDVKADAELHYHKKLTEIYYILEGMGEMELDGDRVPVRPGTAIFIPPGVRHRAIGKLRLINIPVPAFDPEDEWFD